MKEGKLVFSFEEAFGVVWSMQNNYLKDDLKIEKLLDLKNLGEAELEKALLLTKLLLLLTPLNNKNIDE